MITEDYWISTEQITGHITVEKGVIIKTPAVWYKWKGKMFHAFLRSMQKYEMKFKRIGLEG